jgi:hypothetical protein
MARYRTLIQRQEEANKRLEQMTRTGQKDKKGNGANTGNAIPSDSVHLSLLIRLEQAEARVQVLEQEVQLDKQRMTDDQLRDNAKQFAIQLTNLRLTTSRDDLETLEDSKDT